MAIQIPRGTQDILPKEANLWQFIEDQAREICRLYHYEEIRTPIFEATDLFQRGVGDSTDIVQKEMYTFQDRGGRSLTLRPEGTASVVRSYVENKMHGEPKQPSKLFYMGPMFRYERPQSGRTRQFTQFGIEALGSNDPAIDAEVIALAMHFYHNLGLRNLKLVINSLGDPESRSQHRQALIDHFKPSIGDFCQDCQNRLTSNPMRILDCKVDRDHPLMATAPSILDYLNDFSVSFFAKVKQALDDMGIAYEIDPTLVRGLDYYNHTAFEIMGEGFGAITTLSGGGRYNGLVSELGGPETPGIGFALSIERLILAMEAENIEVPYDETIDCFIVTLGEDAERKTPVLLQQMRHAGLAVDQDYVGRKVKGQFKQADRLGAKYVAVLGENELQQGVINLKDMTTGEEETVGLETLATTVKNKLEE
ncbi:histidine--tRNA ligase [Tuberibacillus sp. Marseille-P3662]|uniref:histidine--tRNA ligase n=1 Tax=Tuberibacillus sp. Marseille-P3662 TaxID=1965358 RepID=UPI000A1CB514|nr:histidine--tRNA ligase [Tuberibacillus sp. Marseille-P3662]